MRILELSLLAVPLSIFLCASPSWSDTYSTAGSGIAGLDNVNDLGIGAGDDVNALSAGDDVIESLYDYFSVAPGSTGLDGTGVRARSQQPTPDDEEEWLYRSPRDGTNTAYRHDIVSSGSDLDAYDFTTLGTGNQIYFSVASGGTIAANVIWTVIIGQPLTLAVYMDAASLDLQAGDDIDALSLGNALRFSLTSGSPSAVSGAGGAAVYRLVAGSLTASHTAGVLGLNTGDELNALEHNGGVPEPSTFVLLGTAFLGLMGARWRRKK